MNTEILEQISRGYPNDNNNNKNNTSCVEQSTAWERGNTSIKTAGARAGVGHQRVDQTHAHPTNCS
jgi:hypothetical protein